MDNIVNPFTYFNQPLTTPKVNNRYENISNQDRDILFTKIKHVLGYPIRDLELTNEMMNTYLENAIDDYSSYLANWFINQNWGQLMFLGVSQADFMTAYTTKTLDFEKSFTYAYSKQVGMGNDNPSVWELKKDYIIIEENKQVYDIPAGREINEVLWTTPPFTNSISANILDAGGWVAGNSGWSFFGRPAQFVQPSYTMMLATADFSVKRRLMGSEMTYRVVAGKDGKKQLFLYPVPGGRNEIATFGIPKHYVGSYVWYFYYDTTPNSEIDCLEQNKDIIFTPAQVPFKKLTWGMMNDATQAMIRRLFTAECKMALGQIRGFYGGELKTRDFQLTMDYRHLLEEGQTERTAVFEELKANLEKITYRTLMEDRASISQSTNIVLQFVPEEDVLFRL